MAIFPVYVTTFSAHVGGTAGCGAAYRMHSRYITTVVGMQAARDTAREQALMTGRTLCAVCDRLTDPNAAV